MVFVATGSQRRRKDGNMRQRAECSRYVKVKLFDWNFARNFILPQRQPDIIIPPPVGRGNKRCFCPSVRRVHTCIANNSRTQRPSVSKFGRKVPYVWCDSHTSFKVKRSKVSVARLHDQSEPSWPNAVPVSLEAGGGIPCRPNPTATLLVNIL